MLIKTNNITELFEAGFELARLHRDGSYEGCKTKRRATHLLSETKLSVIAIPLKRWPKHKSKNQGYGKPRFENMDLPTTSDKLDIPINATHVEYSTSRVAIVATVDAVNDFIHMRGQLRFGKYYPTSDRFEYLDDGKPLVDGTCVMSNEHRTMKRVVREPEVPAAPKPPKAKAVDTTSKPAASRTPRAPGGESVCGYIDGLIVEGGRTKEEILALVLAKFPGRDPKSTLSTIGVRPAHIRKAGKVPQPFKK